MDFYAVPLPEYQVGGDSSVKGTLCLQDFQRVIRTTTGTSSSRQLEAARGSSSGRPVATKDPSSEKKVGLHPNIVGEQYSGSSMIVQIISSRRATRSTKCTIKYWRVFVQDLVEILPISKISRSTLRSGDILRATASGLHLGLQRITKTSKDCEE